MPPARGRHLVAQQPPEPPRPPEPPLLAEPPLRPEPPPPEPPTAAALRIAAHGYTATHGDPHAPTPRRRIRWAVSRRLATAAAGVLLLVAVAVGVRAASLAPGPAVSLPTPAPSGPVPAATTPTPVVVDVAGAVVTPGVVRLAAGSRVVDALAAAGGATAEAELGALNLARVLLDGEQIVVPLPGESPAAAAAAPDDGGLVDLNTADTAALDELPGIGPVLAERIAAHRQDRPFTSVDELADVAGIGPTLLERLRDLVRV
ncbi:ComEA family DNA-binding protein [Cellulomonas sp. zg-ZUI168]|nr:ComEA family DNA-binding protein [Cellulomonas fengjieae]